MVVEGEFARDGGGLVRGVLEATRRLQHSGGLQETYARITGIATDVLDDCDCASITVATDGGFETFAPSDPMALTLDLLQYASGQGPCVVAVTSQPGAYAPDVRHDQRWPAFAAAAADEEVGSLLSFRLGALAADQSTVAGLNLYSRRPNAFDREQRDLGLLLAAVAALAVNAARTQAELFAAISTRQVIGEAIGILREQSNLTRDEAFSALSQASQRMNVKLRDVAARIAASSGSSPVTEPAAQPDE